MTKDEAIKKALAARPNHEVKSVKELEKCFVVSVIPKGFNIQEDGPYIGGAVRVDKETGKTGIFNPMFEK